jgi:acylphosphatase
MNQIEILVSGHVQGVHYRKYVKEMAQKYGISGCVKYLSTGGISILAKSNAAAALEEFAKRCSEGNLWTSITSFEIKSYANEILFENFVILKNEWEGEKIHHKHFFKRIPFLQHLF